LLWVKRLVGTTLIAAAVAVALLAVRSLTGDRAHAEATVHEDAARAAVLRQSDLRAVENRVQAAAGLRALNAAVAAHVDSATINDLLDNEDWWRPFRDEFPLVRLIVDGSVLAGRGATGDANAAVGADVVAKARRQTVASGQTSIGAMPYLLAAARLTGESNEEAVLLVGRPAPRPAPALAAPPERAPAPMLPWMLAGGMALAGVGLLVSGGGKAARVARARATAAEVAARSGGATNAGYGGTVHMTPEAPIAARSASTPAGYGGTVAMTPEAVAIPIVAESTLKFGEAREPHNDTTGTLLGVVAPPPPPAPAAPAPTYVIVAPPPAGPHPNFGRYRLVDRLAEGGMSELFIAKAAGIEGFTRSFVLKRLRPELARDKAAVGQFIDEARLQADLVHSNIVPVFDFGVVDGEYFMTQEYIGGRDLGRLLERQAQRGKRGLPSEIAYFAAHETLQALAYAHARRAADGSPLGIVHRDVAAGNILVSLAGEVKLSDFGIVKANDRVSRTQVGIVKGNANYMSPEQARGQAVDARSDLFSLALVLYHCLSGEMLYRGTNDLEVLHHAAGGLLRDDFARIRQLPDPAPQILERALALDPNDRFQTAAEFADELAVFMGGGRNGAAQLVRDLFGKELASGTGEHGPPRTIVGGYGSP
jgi:hypothetical protein